MNENACQVEEKYPVHVAFENCEVLTVCEFQHLVDDSGFVFADTHFFQYSSHHHGIFRCALRRWRITAAGVRFSCRALSGHVEIASFSSDGGKVRGGGGVEGVGGGGGGGD